MIIVDWLLLAAIAALVVAPLRAGEGKYEQAALLPFADDPPVAERVAAATGKVCERVIEPLEELPQRPEDSLLA
ncbi:hypothetical protein D3C81_1379840 [compost metagenome]